MKEMNGLWCYVELIHFGKISKELIWQFRAVVIDLDSILYSLIQKRWFLSANAVNFAASVNDKRPKDF